MFKNGYLGNDLYNSVFANFLIKNGNTQLTLSMEMVKEELQLENPKDVVCIPPIPLPHMHSGFLCLSGGSFMVAVLMIIGVGRCFRLASLC